MEIHCGGEVWWLRAAEAGDETFILSLVPLWASFPLPAGRRRAQVEDGIRRSLVEVFERQPESSFLFVIEDRSRRPVAFSHLQLGHDFFTGGASCHLSDLATAPGFEGRGLGRALLAHAETFARERGCERLTLTVFPGNARARALYEREGFELDTLRMAKGV